MASVSDVPAAWKVHVSGGGKFDISNYYVPLNLGKLVDTAINVQKIGIPNNFIIESQNDEEVVKTSEQILLKLGISKAFIVVFPNPSKAIILTYTDANNGSIIYLHDITIEKDGVVEVRSKTGELWSFGNWDVFMANYTNILRLCIARFFCRRRGAKTQKLD